MKVWSRIRLLLWTPPSWDSQQSEIVLTDAFKKARRNLVIASILSAIVGLAGFQGATCLKTPLLPDATIPLGAISLAALLNVIYLFWPFKEEVRVALSANSAGSKGRQFDFEQMTDVISDLLAKIESESQAALLLLEDGNKIINKNIAEPRDYWERRKEFADSASNFFNNVDNMYITLVGMDSELGILIDQNRSGLTPEKALSGLTKLHNSIRALQERGNPAAGSFEPLRFEGAPDGIEDVETGEELKRTIAALVNVENNISIVQSLLEETVRDFSRVRGDIRSASWFNLMYYEIGITLVIAVSAFAFALIGTVDEIGQLSLERQGCLVASPGTELDHPPEPVGSGRALP
jgi:hypothetical protein